VFLVVLGRSGSAETAREVLDRRANLDKTTRHWNDREQRVNLTLQKKTGGVQHQTLVIYERRRADGEDQTLVIVETPAAVKGTALLSYSHPGRSDEQWAYLPALKRVRQISTSKADRSEAFARTDLSFHDLDVLQNMTSWPEKDAPAVLLGEEGLDGVATYRIEIRPTRPDVYYARIVVWLGKDDVITRRSDFFGDGTEAIKRIDYSDIRAVDGIPVAHRLEARTLAAQSRTVMDVERVRFNQNLEADLFTQRTLARGKR
jgi:hypothetical protein